MPIRPQKGVASAARCRALSYDLATRVDPRSGRIVRFTPQGAQVHRGFTWPERGPVVPGPIGSDANHQAMLIDGSGSTVGSAERPQVGHAAIFPHEGVRLTGRGATCTDNLPAVVDCG